MSSIVEKKVINGILDDWFEVKKIILNKLPNNYSFNNSLSLDGSSIAELPEGLVVKGNLYIGDAPITKLPKKLTIGGYLDLRNSNVEEIGEDTVACHILFNKKLNTRRVYYSNKKDLIPMIANRFVVTDNKLVIPFSSFKRTKFHSYGDEDGRQPLYCVFYKGLYNKYNAICYSENGKRIIAECPDLHEGVRIIERWRLYINRDTSKYDSWSVNDLHTVDELIELYETITDACVPGIDTFIKEKNVDRNALYPVSWILENTQGYEHAHFNYLFEEYWKNKEIK